MSRSSFFVLISSLLCSLVASQIVLTPHVAVQVVCQNEESLESRLNVNAEMSDFFIKLFPDALGVVVTADATFETCIANDVEEVKIASDGILTFITNEYSQEDIKDKVTKKALREHFDEVCDNVLSMDASTEEPGGEAKEGFKARWTSKFCDLQGENDTGLSAVMIAVIAIAALLILCGLYCCCCRC